MQNKVPFEQNCTNSVWNNSKPKTLSFAVMNSAFKRVVPKNNFLPTESNILLESTVNDPAFENSETGCLSINQKVEKDFTNIL